MNIHFRPSVFRKKLKSQRMMIGWYWGCAKGISFNSAMALLYLRGLVTAFDWDTLPPLPVQCATTQISSPCKNIIFFKFSKLTPARPPLSYWSSATWIGIQLSSRKCAESKTISLLRATILNIIFIAGDRFAANRRGSCCSAEAKPGRENNTL